MSGFNNPVGNGNIRVMQAVRIYDEGAHSVFLVSERFELLTPSEMFQTTALLHERKWIVVSNCGGSCDRESSTSNSPVSSIQIYYTVQVDVMPNDTYGVIWTREKLENVLMPILEFNMAKVHFKLESQLIEQGMNYRHANSMYHRNQSSSSLS